MIDFHEKDMAAFSLQVADFVKDFKFKPRGFQSLENFPLNQKQCIYVIDWKLDKITFERGLEALTGYTAEEYDFKSIVNNMHPEDAKSVSRISKGIIIHTVNYAQTNTSTSVLVTFRLKKKDGSYIRVLRQSSIYELDCEGKMISNFSLLTDISFMGNDDMVEWDVVADSLISENFKKIIFDIYKNIFTSREIEIIKLIEKGYTNNQIAEKLFISKLTVATHRKNIFSKSNTSNALDLVRFSKKNGVI